MSVLAIILILSGEPLPTNDHIELAARINEQAEEWRPLLVALAWSESDFRADVESHAGACGILQLMPRHTTDETGQQVTCEWLKSNVRQSVTLAVLELRKWRKNCGKEWMLAAWNQGYQCCRGGWYFRKRQGKQAFDCSEAAQGFAAKVRRREVYVKRKMEVR